MNPNPEPKLLRHLTAGGAQTPSGRAHVCAASGLVVWGGRCFAVADDELHLTAFTTAPNGPLEFVRLLAGELPQDAKERKAEKPDFEVLLHLEPAHWGAASQKRALLAMGSGSKKRRKRGVLLTFKSEGVETAPADEVFSELRVIDLKPLYEALEETVEKLNIEGAVVLGGCLKLLQRDNKAEHHAGGSCRVVEYELEAFLQWLELRDGESANPPRPTQVQRLNLGSAQGVPLAPTDAARVSDDLWVMSAVAEDSENSVLDGPCTGSAVVLLNAANQVLANYPLAGSPKVEGIAASVQGQNIVLKMVTDADDPNQPSQLLEVCIALPKVA